MVEGGNYFDSDVRVTTLFTISAKGHLLFC